MRLDVNPFLYLGELERYDFDLWLEFIHGNFYYAVAATYMELVEHLFFICVGKISSLYLVDNPARHIGQAGVPYRNIQKGHHSLKAIELKNEFLQD